MNFTNCTWELDNIGRKTIEVTFGLYDSIEKELFLNEISGFQYVVVKIRCGNSNVLQELQRMGFNIIETQLCYSKKYTDFNFDDPFLKNFNDKLKFDVISNEDGLNKVLSSLTKNMFTTDRVFLDSRLGPEMGLQRYRNWIKSEFHRGTLLFETYYENQAIAFALDKMENNICHGLLGGIYERFQNQGFGILTPSMPFLFCKSTGAKMTIMKTACSSNNFPVIQFYNYLHFKLDSLYYVLIKHQN